MNKDFPPTKSERQLLSPEEVALRLKISPSFAKKIMERGDIPTVRFGDAVWVDVVEIERGNIITGDGGLTDEDGNPFIWTVFHRSRKRNKSG